MNGSVACAKGGLSRFPMSLRRLLAVTRKEFRHIVRDVRLLSLVTTAPAFLLLTLSYVFALDVDQVDVAVCDLDHTSLSRQLIASLSADGDFSVIAYVERVEDVEALFEEGAADVALVIPLGFADEALGGGPATVQCIADGADAIAAGQTLGLLESRVRAWAASLRAPAPNASQAIAVSSSAWYNKDLKSLISMVPGMQAVVLCMPALALALALAREKEAGSFESLIATPVRGAEYLFGKTLAYEISGMGSVVLTCLVATLWFRVPFRGSFFSFLLLAANYLFASMSISLMMAAFVRNQQTAMFLVLMVFFVPSFFIAGLIQPISREPVARAIAQLLPSTHFILICRSVFLKGLGIRALWRPALALFGIGAVGQAVSLAAFTKRLA